MSLISKLILSKTGTIVEKYLFGNVAKKVVKLSEKSLVREKYGIDYFETTFGKNGNRHGIIAYLSDGIPVNARKHIAAINIFSSK